MGLFSHNTKKEQLVALFGVGSGSVGGALIKFEQDQNHNWFPTIIAEERTYIPFQKEFDYSGFFKDIQLAIKITAEKIYNRKKGVPSSIFCTLTSPWYVSETRRINYQESSVFSVSQNIMDSVIVKELERIQKSYEEKYKVLGTTPFIIENMVLQTTLNGYHIDNPMGMKASNMSINLFLSICPTLLIENIKEIISKIFHTSIEVKFHSFILMMLIIAREKFPEQDSYFLMDVNAEITDIGIVTDGVLVANISFPMGKSYVIRQISKLLNKSEQESRVLFNLYVNGTISSSDKIKLEPVLVSVRDEWTKLLKNSLDSLPQTIAISPNILLIADTDTISFFSTFLSDKNYTKANLGQRYFNINQIDGKQLLDICKVTDGICDQFIMTEAIAIGKMLIK